MPFVPLTADEEDRLAALYSYNIMDTAEEQDFDDLTALASAICQTPIALISLVDNKRQWFKSHKGLHIRETPIDQSFCAHAIENNTDVFQIEDATVDKHFADNPLVTGPMKIVFYAGIPLVNEDGFALGTLCVIDHESKQLTEPQSDALRVLANTVMDKLELKRKMVELEKANQELLESNMFIQKFASMAAHDIKNPLSSVLLTSQALKIRLQKTEDEGCNKLIDLNINATKNLMVLLDDMLAYSKEPSLLIAKKQNVDLLHLLNKVVGSIDIPTNFTIKLPAVTCRLYISAIAVEQIFANLLSNAIRYNDKENGLVSLRFKEDSEYYRFEVEDNGMGIPEQYHEKIFNNNFILKTTDRYNNKSSGIGLATVKELVKALQGTIYVKSVLSQGATFYVLIKK
jgi:signal transduction histidine kinase